MASATIEKRLAALEVEVARLKHKIESNTTPKPWWEQIVGTFTNDPLYEQAMRLGRQYRRSLHPRASSRGKK